MELLKSTIIGLLILLIVFLIGLVIYYRFIRKPTREKFAFVAMATILTLFLAVVLPILNGNIFVNILISLVNTYFSQEITYIQPRLTDQILTLVVYFVICWMIYQMYRNWNSPVKSEREVEFTRKNIPTSLLEDSISFLRKDEQLKVYNPDNREVTTNFLGELNYEKIPWHENVSELLPLLSKQYSINVNNDWYSEYRCYISDYGINEAKVAIYCAIEKPTKSDIRQTLDFISNLDLQIKKLIIAIEEDSDLNDINEVLECNQDDVCIQIKYKREMLDDLVDFTEYERFLKKEYHKKEVSQGTGKTLEDIYVPLSGKFEGKRGTIDRVESYVLNWISDDSTNKHLAILGDYGQGKSVLSLKIAVEMFERSSSRVPIIIELRGKSPRNLSMLEIISTWALQFRLEPHAILKLHYEGQLLILFEGFDEMDLVGDSEIRLNHFRNLWEFAKSPKSKILITGRPNFFLDDVEQKEALGIQDTISAEVPHCQAIYLNSLSKEQISIALRNAEIGIKNSILEAIERSEISENNHFYDLVSRPSTLFLISSIWKQAKFEERKDEINSAIVIKEFIQATYERQAQKANDTPLTVNERSYFMTGIAVGMMQQNGYTNQISSEQLNEIILKLYDSFPESVKHSSNVFEKVNKPLKQRFNEDDQLARESILTDVRSCGILVRDIARNNYFKFAHKSFLELLISEYFIKSLYQDDNLDKSIYNSIQKSLKVRGTVKESKEVIELITELVVIEFTTNKNPRDIFKFITNHRNYYLYIFIEPTNTILLKRILQIMTILFIIVGFLAMTLYSDNNLENFKYQSLVNFSQTVSSVLSSFPYIYIILFVILTVALLLMFYIVYLEYLLLLRSRLHVTSDNLIKIWYEACKKLDIQDSKIENVVPRKYINEIKNLVNEQG